MRKGFTLVELLVVICVAAIAAAIGVPRYGLLRDRLAVDAAASGLMRALADGRHAAVRLGERHAIHADTATGTVRVRSARKAVLELPLTQLFGVALHSSRDSIAYAGTGLGYGAANARYIVARGVSAETITVSRTGRVLR